MRRARPTVPDHVSRGVEGCQSRRKGNPSVHRCVRDHAPRHGSDERCHQGLAGMLHPATTQTPMSPTLGISDDHQIGKTGSYGRDASRRRRYRSRRTRSRRLRPYRFRSYRPQQPLRDAVRRVRTLEQHRVHAQTARHWQTTRRQHPGPNDIVTIIGGGSGIRLGRHRRHGHRGRRPVRRPFLPPDMHHADHTTRVVLPRQRPWGTSTMPCHDLCLT